MRSNWQAKKLDEICDFHNGLWKGKTPPYVTVGVIRNTNFTKDGGLDYSDVVSLDVEKKQFLNRSLRYGDIILEKSGGGPKQPVGRVAIFDKKSGDFSFSNFTSVIRVKKATEIDFNYLHKCLFASYLSGATETMQSHSTGIRNLKFSEYKQISVPIPPLTEQKRIVAVLDEAFVSIAKAKENAEKNLANSRELFASYLQTIIANHGANWKKVQLGEVCKITDGTHFSPRNTCEGKYMYITAKNIKRYAIDLTKVTYLTEQDHREIYKRCPVKKGDVLYIKDGATAGIAALNTIDEEFSLLSSVALLKPFGCLLNTFLVHYMNSDVGRSNFLGYVDGAAITRLTLSKLKNVTIPLPSLVEQKHIVARLDAIAAKTQELEVIYHKQTENLVELKKSILQKAFSGELVGAHP